MYRRGGGGVELLLVRFGGPYWRNRDAGAWAIPKGLIEEGESAEAAARREFEEELGTRCEGALIPLPPLRQKGGKWVEAFALEGDFDPAALNSNEFSMDWPPKSGRIQAFPEVEEARWFSLAEAREKMLASQLPLIDAIEAVAGG